MISYTRCYHIHIIVRIWISHRELMIQWLHHIMLILLAWAVRVATRDRSGTRVRQIPVATRKPRAAAAMCLL